MTQLAEYASVKTFLAARVEDSHSDTLEILGRFLAYRQRRGLQTDPDQLVREARRGTMETREEHNRVLRNWVERVDDKELANCEKPTLYHYYREVRALYKHNGAELPKEKLSLPTNGSVVEVPAEGPTANDYLVMVDRVLNAGRLSQRDRSLVTTKVQGFMDGATLCKVFNYVAFPQLAKHFGTENWELWDVKKVPVRIDLVRTKSGYVHYTFLDFDAMVEIKRWLTIRAAEFGPIRIYPSTNPKVLPRSDPIYVMRYFGAVRPLRPQYVSILWTRNGKKAGVNVEPETKPPPGKLKYPFRSHEVRDVAITLARSARVDREVVEFFAGHNIDKLGYDKSPWNDPEFFREQYRKLAPFLNVLSGKEARARREAEKAMELERRELEDQEASNRAQMLQLKDQVRDLSSQLARLTDLVQKGAKVDPVLMKPIEAT